MAITLLTEPKHYSDIYAPKKLEGINLENEKLCNNNLISFRTYKTISEVLKNTNRKGYEKIIDQKEASDHAKLAEFFDSKSGLTAASGKTAKDIENNQKSWYR